MKNKKRYFMILQHILFPKEDICKETELYYRHPSKQFGGKFSLPPNQTISFDTYFNSFSIEKWKEYTFIENLSLNLKATGKCRIALYEATLINEKVRTRLLFSKDKNSQENEIMLAFPEIRSLHGLCYFTITSDNGPCEITDGFYSAEIDSISINRIKIGIGICTYKREHFILKNLKAIQDTILDNPESELRDNLEIIVSDNGETLQNYNYTHPKVKIFTNINAGGSGGFARCMIEAIKAQENLNLTHFLLMDDDILLDPAVLVRTYKFLQLLKKEHQDKLLGGTMLKLEKPFEQLEFGAKSNLNLGGNWWIQNNPNYNLSIFDVVIKNELTNTVVPDYNGWWYCCIPIQFINSNNLPLPFFIHCDDMEYCCRVGKEIILINGITVWHSFQNKATPVLYYDTRNRLIVSIIKDSQSCTRCSLMKFILTRFLEIIPRYMYQDWALFSLAIKDVCNGPTFFKQTNPVQLHKKITENFHIKKIDCKNITKDFLPIPKIEEINKKMEHFSFSQKIFFIISILNAFIPFGRCNPVCVNNLCFQSFWKRNYVVWKYSENSDEAICLRKSPTKAIKAFIDMLEIQLLVFRKWNKIKKDYIATFSELTSFGFWKNYLRLKKE